MVRNLREENEAPVFTLEQYVRAEAAETGEASNASMRSVESGDMAISRWKASKRECRDQPRSFVYRPSAMQIHQNTPAPDAMRALPSLVLSICTICTYAYHRNVE